MRMREQLNVVGLIRGTCSLAADFGSNDESITIKTSNGAIVVVELEPDYILACSVTLAKNANHRLDALVQQLRALVLRTHRTYCLQNASFDRLQKLHGERLGELLGDYWEAFLQNYNYAAKLPYGPKNLIWPTRINYGGVFGFLDGYKKSSVRIPDSSITEVQHILAAASTAPHGIFVANMNREIPKKSGVIYTDLRHAGVTLDKATVVDIFNMLELLSFNGQLKSETFARRNPLSGVFERVFDQNPTVEQDLEEVDSDDELHISNFNFSPAAALELLHPVKLTNNLIVLPLNMTMHGMMYLGLAVNDQMPGAPSWLGRWRGQGEEPVEVSPLVEEEQEPGHYIVGLQQDQISRFLVHIPTEVDGEESERREYLLVLYEHNGILLGLIFDSGLGRLSENDFYLSLESSVCQPVLEVVSEAIQTSSGGFALSSSIGSLPGPYSAMNEKAMAEVDSDFFFIVYDAAEKSFQSSLPYAPIVHEILQAHAELGRKLGSVIFHLHDQLVNHFFVKSAGRMLVKNSVVNEHLHKFSSNKNNDWLFYAFRYRKKVIFIIRNYNHKGKTPRVVESGYLHQLAESVHANLGFLDNLGDDVKAWLAELGKE